MTSIIWIKFAGQLDPRSLTVQEVMEATEMNITSLLDHGKSSNTEAAPAVIEEVPLEHLALGTNLEKVPVKDLVRMPGTKWCGIGWRTDTVQQFGGYAGTDRYPYNELKKHGKKRVVVKCLKI